jgi:hypothetical protein
MINFDSLVRMATNLFSQDRCHLACCTNGRKDVWVHGDNRFVKWNRLIACDELLYDCFDGRPKP